MEPDSLREPSHSFSGRDFSVYRCPNCRRGRLDATSDDRCQCVACQKVYPITRNVLDLLLHPSPDVIQELQGTAREQGLPIERWAEMKVALTTNMKGLEELLELTKDDPVQYYQQTTTNFQQAFEVIAGKLETLAVPKVLEIGSCGDYYFLKPFAEKGARCFSSNIGFYFKTPDPYLEWPEKTLADMNDLPFREATFDFVVISATSHHSPDIERTIAELSRVTKVGGAVLMVNDPIHGLLKQLGGRREHGRDQLIHENEFTLLRYHRNFIRQRFEPEYLFSRFHDEKLLAAKIHPDTRFATIARQLAKLWRVPTVRGFAKERLLWIAQSVFGFPLNVVLWRN